MAVGAARPACADHSFGSQAYQISQPLFDGRFRWREPPPRGLTREERMLVRAECSDLLEVLNYSQPGEDWVEV